MGFRVFAINMQMYVISRDQGLSAVMSKHCPCTLLREACHLGGEGADAVVRDTSDNDRGQRALVGVGGHATCSPVTEWCCRLGNREKRM